MSIAVPSWVIPGCNEHCSALLLGHTQRGCRRLEIVRESCVARLYRSKATVHETLTSLTRDDTLAG